MGAVDSVASIPDVDASAGMPDASAEAPAPSMDDMAAIMADAAGETSDAGSAPAPAPPAVEAKAPDAPAATPDADAKPVDPAVAADAVKLRKGWAQLARDKEAVIRRTNEANQAMESAKAFREKAEAYDNLPQTVLNDPLGFLFKVAGKKTVEEQEAFTMALLDKVVETEKSPTEREIAKLRAEVEAEKAAAKRTAQEAEQRLAQQNNERVLSAWTERNIKFAESDPDRYDLINSLSMGEAVHQTCQAYWDLHKAILDPAVAADDLESRLRAGAKKSKHLKSLFAASPAPAPKAAPVKAQPSNGTTTAPKPAGNTFTLTSVAAGDGAADAASEFPNESEARMDAILRDMAASGELPDDWRPKR